MNKGIKIAWILFHTHKERIGINFGILYRKEFIKKGGHIKLQYERNDDVRI